MRKVYAAFISILIAVALYGDAGAWKLGVSVVAPTTYDGLAGTRGSAPGQKLAQTQAMARTAIFSRSAITQIKIITPNWYGAELAPGSTATVTASIEYPAATCTQLKWSAATSSVIPDGGQVTSDYVTISIPANTQFWVRQYTTNASGVVAAYYQGQNLSLGDALVVGNSGVADQTVSCGTVTDGGTFTSIPPLAVIAPIALTPVKLPSVCILGDSIAIGVNNDFAPNSVGDSGEIAPSIGPSFGYSNMGVNGETAANFVSTHTNRAAVLQYCSSTIVQYGINDLQFGASVAALQASLTTIYGLAPGGATVFQNTLIPFTSSTDGWATTVNQTTSAFESNRVAFNSALTSASFGPNGGYFDPQPVVGTSTNNSLWKAGAGFPACSPWTTDGVHPSTCTYYTQLQGSGYIDLSRIH